MPTQQMYDDDGMKPVTTKWVDKNKGGTDDPEYRCRLVARAIRCKGEDSILIATPPLEVLKFLFKHNGEQTCVCH